MEVDDDLRDVFLSLFGSTDEEWQDFGGEGTQDVHPPLTDLIPEPDPESAAAAAATSEQTQSPFPSEKKLSKKRLHDSLDSLINTLAPPKRTVPSYKRLRISSSSNGSDKLLSSGSGSGAGSALEKGLGLRSTSIEPSAGPSPIPNPNTSPTTTTASTYHPFSIEAYHTRLLTYLPNRYTHKSNLPMTSAASFPVSYSTATSSSTASPSTLSSSTSTSISNENKLSPIEASRNGWISIESEKDEGNTSTTTTTTTTTTSNATTTIASDAAKAKAEGKVKPKAKAEGLDRVQCITCGVKWGVRVFDLGGGGGGVSGQVMRRKMIDLLAEQFRLAHKNDCPWKVCPSPSQLHHSLLKSFHSLLSGDLAEVARRIEDGFEKSKEMGKSKGKGKDKRGVLEVVSPLTEEQATSLTKNLQQALLSTASSEEQSQPNQPFSLSQTSSLLALFGWRPYQPPSSKSTSAVEDVLHCRVCGRVVGLWGFRRIQQQQEITEGNAMEVDSTSTRAIKGKPFNLLREHRDFCPILSFSGTVVPPPSLASSMGESNGIDGKKGSWWDGLAILKAAESFENVGEGGGLVDGERFRERIKKALSG